MWVLVVQRNQYENCKYLGRGVDEQAVNLRHPLKKCISINVASYGVWSRLSIQRIDPHFITHKSTEFPSSIQAQIRLGDCEKM